MSREYYPVVCAIDGVKLTTEDGGHVVDLSWNAEEQDYVVSNWNNALEYIDRDLMAVETIVQTLYKLRNP